MNTQTWDDFSVHISCMKEGDIVGCSSVRQLLSAYRSRSGRPRWREMGTKITEKEDMRRFTHRKLRVLGFSVKLASDGRSEAFLYFKLYYRETDNKNSEQTQSET